MKTNKKTATSVKVALSIWALFIGVLIGLPIGRFLVSLW